MPAFLIELKDAIARVASFPQSGRRLAADGDPQLRGVLVGPYRLTYRALDESVHLVLLQHLRRSSSSVELTRRR